MMDWSRKALRQRVKHIDRKIVFIHTLVSVGLMLLLTVADYILMDKVNETSGLAGIGSRAILETLRTILQYVGMILLPFWELGLVFASLRMARGQQVSTYALKEGFRRFWTALRLMLLRLVLCLVAGIAAMQVSLTTFLYTPLSDRLTALVAPFAEKGSDVQTIFQEIPFHEIQAAVLPALILFAVLFLGLLIPVLYRVRFADFAVMDGAGAFASLLSSNRRMKRNCFKLLRVDLQFWWFYLLEVLVVVLCYGNTLLQALGVTLPLSEGAGFFLFYGLYALCQLGLHSLFRGRVQTTYAAIYDDLKEQV